MAEGCMRERDNFHYECIKLSIERLEERRKSGEEYVQMHVGELQSLLGQLLSMNLRCNHLEDVLVNYVKFAFPTYIKAVPPVEVKTNKPGSPCPCGHGWDDDGDGNCASCAKLPKAIPLTPKSGATQEEVVTWRDSIGH